eukprot:846577_1
MSAKPQAIRTVKVVLSDNETYRLEGDDVKNLKSVVKYIKQKLNQKKENFTLKYKDEDNESIRISDDKDLESAFTCVRNQNIQSLKIFVEFDGAQKRKPKSQPPVESKEEIAVIKKPYNVNKKDNDNDEFFGRESFRDARVVKMPKNKCAVGIPMIVKQEVDKLEISAAHKQMAENDVKQHVTNNTEEFLKTYTKTEYAYLIESKNYRGTVMIKFKETKDDNFIVVAVVVYVQKIIEKKNLHKQIIHRLINT